MQRRKVRGFTLIELMLVVGIIGIIASIAIPLFQRYSLRAKTAERALIQSKIEDSLVAFVGEHDCFPGDCPGLGGSFLFTPQNPPGVPSPLRASWDPTLAPWSFFEGAPQAQLYFRYDAWGMMFSVPGFSIGILCTDAWSDLDGDGIVGTRTRCLTSGTIFGHSSWQHDPIFDVDTGYAPI
jgi:type IV pilus assembly protein PilA